MNTDVHGDISRSLLLQMKKGGFDFAGFHPIEFYVCFPSQQAATQAASLFRGESLNAQISTDEQGRCYLQLSKVMVATHTGIREFEASLQDLVAPLGGITDGWGVEQHLSDGLPAAAQE